MERNLLVIIKDYFLSEQDKLLPKDESSTEGLDRRSLNILEGIMPDVEEVVSIDSASRERPQLLKTIFVK